MILQGLFFLYRYRKSPLGYIVNSDLLTAVGFSSIDRKNYLLVLVPRKMIKLSREHKKLVGTSAIQAYHVLKHVLDFPNSEQREITLTALTENHGAIYSSLGKRNNSW